VLSPRSGELTERLLSGLYAQMESMSLLIIQIPCHNEEKRLPSLGTGGLRPPFRTGIDTSLGLGTDYIVNTDSDNQYSTFRRSVRGLCGASVAQRFQMPPQAFVAGSASRR
jgi:hypothetical protein